LRLVQLANPIQMKLLFHFVQWFYDTSKLLAVHQIVPIRALYLLHRELVGTGREGGVALLLAETSDPTSTSTLFRKTSLASEILTQPTDSVL